VFYSLFRQQKNKDREQHGRKTIIAAEDDPSQPLLKKKDGGGSGDDNSGKSILDCGCSCCIS